jgi:raffinose/stachyose/melibiose transport system permease protein
MAEMARETLVAGREKSGLRGLFREMVKKKQCYLLLIPTFALLLTFNYYPAASAIYHSFFEWNGVNVLKFIGLRNFVEMMQDPTIHVSFLNVVKLTVTVLIISLTFPLMGAELIYHLKDTRFAYFYRVLFVIPLVVPSLVTILIWRFIYNPNIGLLNQLLKAIGAGSLARPWLGDFDLALFAVIFVGFPWVAGFAMLIYLAGLQNIPTSVIEAAILDGVTPISRFTRIELPLIAAQLKLIAILTLIGAIQGFVNIFVMTNGGPGEATMVPGLHLYKNAMYYNKMGYASAIGTFLFVVILALTYINLRYIRSSVEYEGG